MPTLTTQYDDGAPNVYDFEDQKLAQWAFNEVVALCELYPYRLGMGRVVVKLTDDDGERLDEAQILYGEVFHRVTTALS